MEAATLPSSSIHHRHQPPCSALQYSFLLRSASSSSPPPSSSIIRASSSSDPEPKNSQILNPLPKSSPSSSSFDPPEPKSPQFFNPIRKSPSFATVAAASAFLFLGFCRNGCFVAKPVATPSSVASIDESLEERSDLGDFLGSRTHQSVLHLKLKERIPVVHSFKKTRTDDDEAWEAAKAQVFSCGEQLELVKVGFEEILEKDQDCNKAHQDRVLEYLEMVDKCKGLLKGIKLAMDRCERENGDVKQYLRFINKVVARIKVLEGDMVGALKHYKELEEQ